MEPSPGTVILVPLFYREWKRYGRHLEEYGSEFVGTLFLMVCVVGVVALLFASDSPLPRLVPSTAVRLFVAGAFLGSSGWLVAISPPGRLSGAHLNPALSVGFWLLGKMHFRDLLGYVCSQLAGGVLGAYVAQGLFGAFAGEVHDALLEPARFAGVLGTFGAEAGATFVLGLVVYTCVSRPSLMRKTPGIATLVVAVLVCVDGNFSGCGINPARWIGPAVVEQSWQYSSAYFFGPIVGAVLAVALRRGLSREAAVPHTAKLFHDPTYRSIFKHDAVPSTPPADAGGSVGRRRSPQTLRP